MYVPRQYRSMSLTRYGRESVNSETGSGESSKNGKQTITNLMPVGSVLLNHLALMAAMIWAIAM